MSESSRRVTPNNRKGRMMKSFARCFLVLVIICVGRIALTADAPTKRARDATYCGRDNLPASCAEGGIGGTNGGDLEGKGLEGRRFALSASKSGKPFPPQKGKKLTDKSGCDRTPLELQIDHCDSGTTAVACQVSSLGGQICGNKNTKGVGVTIVMGYWNARGAYEADSDIVTVACNAEASMMEDQPIANDGALTRCSKDFRFEAKDKNEGLTACIRMQRADYCGDGIAHTFVGTNLDVHTPKNPVERKVCSADKKCYDDCTDGRCFEATWDENGAACVGHTRWTNPGWYKPKDPAHNIDFDKLPCKKEFTEHRNGMLCRPGKKPTDYQLMTRSKINKCEADPPDCTGKDSCPGCE